VDAYTTALTWLARRELSVAQLRSRLARRKFAADEIDAAVSRLASDHTVDDKRVAVSAARLEGAIRNRGRRRALQRVEQLGINPGVARAAVDEVFADIDENAQLDRALDRKLKGVNPRDLDAKAAARVVRSLIGQGFEPGRIYARLRARGTAEVPED
jgi:SOS response regulatory protein OraA/RecX